MRTSAELMFQSTLVRRWHRGAAGALAVALSAALIGAVAVLWAQTARETPAPERVAVPALGTSTPTATAPAAASGAAPPVAPPPVAAAPTPPQPQPPPAPAQVSQAVTQVQVEAPITFQPAGTRLTAAGQQSVSRVAGLLRDAPGTRVRVVGHSAVVQGNPSIALRMSQQRAELVASTLQAGGIAAERLEVSGAGDTQPMPGPAASRRVVISVI